MKCAECSDRWKCGAGYDLRRKRRSCEKAKKPVKRSNADRIRAMTDEELAEFFENPEFNSKPWYRCNECKWESCIDCMLEWLKQECDDNGT